MRSLHLIFAVTILALWLPSGRAQDAVLVLAPSPAVTVRAGSGSAGFSGDGGAAAAAHLAAPSSIARDSQGNLFLADTRNHRIRRIAPDGIITTVAGTGDQGFAGDGGPATQAQLDSPSGIAVASDGTLYVADTHNHRIRHIDSSGHIHTVVGTGAPGFGGDGAAATAAQLSSPLGVAIGLTGDLYIADTGNHRIRHTDARGTIATVAGDGAQGNSADGAQATSSHLNQPAAITVRTDGSVLIADRGNNRILILQTDGTLRLLNTASLSLRRPSGVALNSFGDTLIADSGNYRVAQVSSSGAGTALGSGVQGAPITSSAPTSTPFGAPVSVLDTTSADGPTQFSAVDRDNNQVVQVSIPQIYFPDTIVATASTSRSLLLRNAGAAALTVAAVNVPAPFGIATSSCGTAPIQLSGGSSCTFTLLFNPQTVGAVSGILEADPQNAPPQRVMLSGTGLRTGTQLPSSTTLQTSGSLSYAGTPLTFSAAVLGGSSAAATGTVTFLDGITELGSSPLNASAQATLTTSNLMAGSHNLTARYNGDPAYLRSASATVALTVVTPPDFSMTAATPQLTLKTGGAGTLVLTLQPLSGVLNQNVNVSVSGLPTGSALTVTPVPVTLASAPINVSIAFKLPISLSRTSRSKTWLACLLPPLLLNVPKRRKSRFLLGSMLAIALMLQGCGGGYLSNANVGAQSASSTYPVVVTASCPGVTGATLTHSIAFTVVVQP